MLNSLEIRNYRNIEHLQIEKLGRVNLLTGKNNTGKSSILEALSIYASGGNMRWIFELLKNRNEFIETGLLGRRIKRDNGIEDSDLTQTNQESTSNLFFNRNNQVSEKNCIFIGEKIQNPDLHITYQPNSISIFNRIEFHYYRNLQETTSRNEPVLATYSTTSFDTKTQEALETISGNILPSLYITKPRGENAHVGRIYRFHQNIQSQDDATSFNQANYKYITAGSGLNGNQNQVNAQDWDNVALSEKENNVIKILQIIDPNIQRLNFIQGAGFERIPVVKLKNQDKPVPLKSMGDGVNRLLGIALALVNAEGGYFFIDEVENGLHYGVQEQLWKIVFHLAAALNVQVFATTHSSDCIGAFAKIANQDKENEGFLIRLDNRNDKIVPTVYDEELLEAAMEINSEVR